MRKPAHNTMKLWSTAVVAALALSASACRRTLPRPTGGTVDPVRSDEPRNPRTPLPDPDPPPATDPGTANPDPGAETPGDPMDAAVDNPDATADAGIDTGAPEVGQDEPRNALPPMTACGRDRPAIAGLRDVDGLVIGRDGSIFFTQVAGGDTFVGRLVPKSTAEERWVRVAAGNQPTRLALDGGRMRLYAASASARAVFVIDLAQPEPKAVQLIGGLGDPSAIVVSPRGDVLVADARDRVIYQITDDGKKERVTKSTIGDAAANAPRPNALAFTAQGNLLVGMSRRGRLFLLDMKDGREDKRATFGTFENWANGLAIDEIGRVYVAAFAEGGFERLIRLDATGTTQQVLAGQGRFGSLAFGRGALACRDLYVADTAGAMIRIPVDAQGIPVP